MAARSWSRSSRVRCAQVRPVAGRLGLVAFGAADPKGGALGSLYNLGADPRLNHELVIVDGVRADECAALLTEFFGAQRDATPH